MIESKNDFCSWQLFLHNCQLIWTFYYPSAAKQRTNLSVFRSQENTSGDCKYTSVFGKQNLKIEANVV